jgi:hypothetical protein
LQTREAGQISLEDQQVAQYQVDVANLPGRDAFSDANSPDCEHSMQGGHGDSSSRNPSHGILCAFAECLVLQGDFSFGRPGGKLRDGISGRLVCRRSSGDLPAGDGEKTDPGNNHSDVATGRIGSELLLGDQTWGLTIPVLNKRRSINQLQCSSDQAFKLHGPWPPGVRNSWPLWTPCFPSVISPQANVLSATIAPPRLRFFSAHFR